MGTLYIDRKDIHIRLDGQALAFYSNNAREGVVPLNPLRRVVIVGNVTLETPVLHRFSDKEISAIFLSGKRLRFCGMLHGRLHNNGILRVKQYEKSLMDFSREISRELAKRKILSQKEFLLDVRERRPPEDPVNAMLSLCYTLLHFETVREIEVIGLDPTIGFYHQFEYGRESLACDLVELFRTGVDRFIWEMFRERKFTDRDFANDDERPGCYLKKASRKEFYPLYEEWAKGIRPQLVNEVRSLAARIMDGPDIISE